MVIHYDDGEEDIKSIQKALGAAEQELSDAEEKLISAQVEIENLEQDLESANEDLMTALADIEDLKSEAKDAQIKCSFCFDVLEYEGCHLMCPMCRREYEIRPL